MKLRGFERYYHRRLDRLCSRGLVAGLFKLVLLLHGRAIGCTGDGLCPLATVRPSTARSVVHGVAHKQHLFNHQPASRVC